MSAGFSDGLFLSTQALCPYTGSVYPSADIMSHTLPPLSELLSVFSTATVRQSRDCVGQIVLSTLNIQDDGQNIVAYAEVDEAYNYECSVCYNRRLRKISKTRCNCTVGHRCKHAAALVRLLHAQLNATESITADTANVYGTPQPFIRFGQVSGGKAGSGGKCPPNPRIHAHIGFRYPCGTVAAHSTTAYFIGKHDGQNVRQYRDEAAETAALTALKNLLPSLAWQTRNGGAWVREQDIFAALLPHNRLADNGWQVEHRADSPVRVLTVSAAEWVLKESGENWFDIGATITAADGARYDFLDIVAELLAQHRYLLDPDIADKLPPEHYFTVSVGADRPPLAVPLQDILPVAQHLRGLFERGNRRIDAYDAANLSEQAQNSGITWQLPDKLNLLAEKLKQGYSSSLPTPAGFNGKLRPYQQQGLAWLQFLRDTEHGGILADDMGLGKTAQTLAHILLEKQAGRLKNAPVLIVAPTSLMGNWQKEAAKFTPDLKVLLLHGDKRKEALAHIADYNMVLTTYPLLPRDEESLLPYSFHQIILDEAQNIKNPRSKAAQVLRRLKSAHRLCLTGTPLENHLGELWSLFHFLMPGFLGSQEDFNKKYRHPIEKKGDSEMRQRLVRRVRPFVLRRLKSEVAKELPPKTTIEVSVEMNDAQSKLYESVRAAMQQNIRQIIAEQGFKRSQIQILDALLKLRQVCCSPALLKAETLPEKGKKSAKRPSEIESAKLVQLSEMVQSLVGEGRKILIFSQFTTMLGLIGNELDKLGIAWVKLTGQTKKRSEVIEAFQHGDIPVFLISLKAGGTGLNLTAADTVIHYDPWWNPAAESQASDRVWRIGQDKPVFVYKLITARSIEEKITALQQKKAQLAESVLSADHEDGAKWSEADVMALLEGF
ncbi:DEAD/DEAH box helicase [Neisseria perflava]|uniref:DEAD/DEAH box helicase n=1 Tax=Neisseria perflava TaxID=33053 RepID=UPI00209D11A5|nr:DEAD/DEAH box helicase [Neisseria perflava]MCP1659986.1 superfamily II DNA or RNA helicase [Neisseria perflava]MCP1771997.1 superfamily II DNA or RNA helicase [Neisseria perflava]